MKLKNTLLLLLLALPLYCAAKPSYKITLQIDGNTDSVMYIGYYYAQHTYVCDTALSNGHGRFQFEGNHELLPGLYFFSNAKGRYVEFVVYGEKQQFRFRTSESDWTANMTVSGSEQNRVFYEYHHANNGLYEELNAARKSMDSSSLAAFQRHQYERLDSLKYSIMDRYPQSMIARMISATRDVSIPTTDSAGNTLAQNDRWRYLADHYFDYIPLDDNFIVRTPQAIFYQRVIDYRDKVLQGLPPEMLIPLIDTMIERSNPAPEVFKWLVHTMTEHYLQSPIMVYDEVYVHLVQRYYATGRAFWSSPAVIDEQVERATKWERILVGREAPELILFDTLRHPRSLHHMPGRYTLLLFWSPTCGHCRDIIPAVYDVFAEYAEKLDLSAFAILTEPDEETEKKWKHFLAEHGMTSPRWVNFNGGEANVDWREVYDVTTTPQIFFIDNKDHKILAKKLGADILRQICERL